MLMKQQFQFPCIASTLKVCIVFIVLTSAISLACWGGGGGYEKKYADKNRNYSDDYWEEYLNYTVNKTFTVIALDPTPAVNLTGISDVVDRNIKSAWRGWEPNKKTQDEWREWNEKWLIENAKNGEVPWSGSKNKGKGDEEDYEADKVDDTVYAERGPGSSWPDLPTWSALGFGSDGAPVPPWGFAPRNVGKRSLCYVPPILGDCPDEKDKEPEMRWGYNPYIDDCQEYVYSGCGGSRNRFVTKEACMKQCAELPPPSCSVKSDILDRSPKKRG